MSDRAVVVTVAAIVLVITQARTLSGNPDQIVAAGFLPILALIIVLDRQARQKRKRLHAAAVEAWHREFGARLRIELDRGVTETMARHLVEPVVERVYPRTYEAAVAFLDSRGIVVQDSCGRPVPGEHGGGTTPMP